MSVEILRDPAEAVAWEGDDAVLPRLFTWVLGFGRWGLGPALGVAALYLAACAVAFAIGERSISSWPAFVATQLTYAIWFAAVPVGVHVLVRGAARDARDLAPVLGAQGGEVSELVREALTVPPRALWWGAGGGVLFVLMALCVFVNAPAAVQMGLVFVALRELLLEVPLFVVLGWGVGAAARLSQLTAERARPDLLAPRAFAPLARNGTRFAGFWLVLVAITFPGMLVTPEAAADQLGLVVAVTLVCAALAAVVLVVPCRGARRVLRAAKAAELARVRGEIAEARAGREDTRLPGLLAWEERIQSVAEWPIDVGVLSRTGVFVVLPLASWVGAALVERLVDASLS